MINKLPNWMAWMFSFSWSKICIQKSSEITRDENMHTPMVQCTVINSLPMITQIGWVIRPPHRIYGTQGRYLIDSVENDEKISNWSWVILDFTVRNGASVRRRMKAQRRPVRAYEALSRVKVSSFSSRIYFFDQNMLAVYFLQGRRMLNRKLVAAVFLALLSFVLWTQFSLLKVSIKRYRRKIGTNILSGIYVSLCSYCCAACRKGRSVCQNHWWEIGAAWPSDVWYICKFWEAWHHCIEGDSSRNNDEHGKYA